MTIDNFIWMNRREHVGVYYVKRRKARTLNQVSQEGGCKFCLLFYYFCFARQRDLFVRHFYINRKILVHVATISLQMYKGRSEGHYFFFSCSKNCRRFAKSPTTPLVTVGLWGVLLLLTGVTLLGEGECRMAADTGLGGRPAVPFLGVGDGAFTSETGREGWSLARPKAGAWAPAWSCSGTDKRCGATGRAGKWLGGVGGCPAGVSDALECAGEVGWTLGWPGGVGRGPSRFALPGLGGNPFFGTP